MPDYVVPNMHKSILMVATALALVAVGCSSYGDIRKKMDRDPLVGVIYALKPQGERNSMQITYDKEGVIAQNFPEVFTATATNVRDGIAEAWPLPRTYVVQNRAEFKADLIAGVWLKGWYVNTSGTNFKFVIEAYVVFMEERLREYIGKPEGYLVATSETKEFDVSEVRSFLDRGMKRQAFEQLLRFIPPEKVMPEFGDAVKQGTMKLIQDIKG